MPPRRYIVAVVVFWAATVAWLFLRDLGAVFSRASPPPFTIDLADEAQSQADGGGRVIPWQILDRDGVDKGYAYTGVAYEPDSDTFRLGSDCHLWTHGRRAGGDADCLLRTHYGVTPEGELRRLDCDLTAHFGGLEVSAHVQGTVKDGWLTTHLDMIPAFPGKENGFDLDRVRVGNRGSILNPMFPLNRLPGLRKGQHWQMPLVDPLADVFGGLAARSPLPVPLPGSSVVEAEVLPETRMLDWGRRMDRRTPCLIIRYRKPGEDYSGETWVGETDSLVYKQQMSFGGESMTLLRLDPHSRVDLARPDLPERVAALVGLGAGPGGPRPLAVVTWLSQRVLKNDPAPRGPQGVRNQDRGGPAQPRGPRR